jgi:hypothetical protein
VIRDGEDLHRARRGLGWSVTQLARALRLCPPDAAADDQRVKKAGDRIREMERDVRDISGPVSVAVEAFEQGFRPEGFKE